MTTSAINRPSVARPLLKWAGGKSQLLPELLSRVPKHYGKYIEPFFGGGAMFFALRPRQSVIADSNPELVNLYRVVAADVEAVIRELRRYSNSEEVFYSVRALDWRKLSPSEAAARTIFLNKTCFNGLYRVNKSGAFNVPFGRYKTPRICDEGSLRVAAEALAGTTFELGDYKDVLRSHAKSGDFVFLDPPYLPVSAYADFKRYTKEQFYEEDHVELAEEVKRLRELGCHVVLTNSNHPLVHDLYSQFEIEVVETRRYISCNGNGRRGQDVIVEARPRSPRVSTARVQVNEQVKKFPATRYMGSKQKLLLEIWGVASQFEFETAIDLFSGSAAVGYMFKAQGKRIVSNDYMAMSATYAKALVENNSVRLTESDVERIIEAPAKDRFVQKTFKGLYFSDSDNRFIDRARNGIARFRNPHKRAIGLAALVRACLKKRPRGVFTYVGDRYNDGRRDLALSIQQHFVEAIATINAAVFDNGLQNKARQGDALTVASEENSLVYIDPPYYSPLSDNEYVRRYHFVEGLARDWEGVEIQEHTQTKKFKSYPTPFSSRSGAAEAFEVLFRRFRDSKILVSYSSNSLPTLREMVALLARFKTHVDVVPVDYRYSFGNQGHKVKDNRNAVQEYLFIGF